MVRGVNEPGYRLVGGTAYRGPVDSTDGTTVTDPDETVIRFDPYPKNWLANINCGTATHNIFFGEIRSTKGNYETETWGSSDMDTMMDLCGSCPGNLHCLRSALTVLPEYGVWAGHKAQNIRRIRYRRLDDSQRKQLDGGSLSIKSLYQIMSSKRPRRRKSV